MAHNRVADGRADTSDAPLLVRVLSWVVLGVMAIATAYTAWVAVANLNRIGV